MPVVALQWGDPPPVARNSWKRIAGELMDRPGEWALLAEGLSPSEAENVRRSLLYHQLRVARRKVPGVGVSVWACWDEDDI